MTGSVNTSIDQISVVMIQLPLNDWIHHLGIVCSTHKIYLWDT